MAVERDLNTIAFPILGEEQMAKLGRYAGTAPKKFRAGEALFHAGDRDSKFFVIKSGKVDIVDVTGDQPKTVRVIGPGEFTGDVGHLTGNPKVVSAIAQSNCEAYEISEENLRQILNQDPELSDIILQAFIGRRQLMRESGEFTGLRVIGSRYSQDTFRIRDFLAKNLTLLEPGLRLYEEEGITGVEFPVGGRYVDILAVDSAGNDVVIELKVSRGYDRVVGQLLRYMAWIAQHHAEPTQKVRGIIVAREISSDLLLACSSLANVSLFEYQLSVSLKKVQLG